MNIDVYAGIKTQDGLGLEGWGASTPPSAHITEEELKCHTYGT